MALFLAEIDWRREWLDSVRQAAAPVLNAANWREGLNSGATKAALCNHLGKPIHFVRQEQLPSGMAYEAFISSTGGVPTRDNLHDFFNALVWLSFPRIKVRLNALQAAEIEQAVASGAVAPRGSVRDAATIFDENASILVVSDISLLDGLRAHRWVDVFMNRRQDFRASCEVFLFGHALMEKLVRPYKAITSHVWPVLADQAIHRAPYADKLAWIDSVVSTQLRSGLRTSNFTPLPVLGVPTWWQGQDAAFYRDTSVFRPKRIS